MTPMMHLLVLRKQNYSNRFLRKLRGPTWVVKGFGIQSLAKS